jgi:hypothetical protein
MLPGNTFQRHSHWAGCAICLSEDARQVKSRLDLAMSDLGATQLKNIAEPIRVYSLEFRRPLSLAKQNMSI